MAWSAEGRNCPYSGCQSGCWRSMAMRCMSSSLLVSAARNRLGASAPDARLGSNLGLPNAAGSNLVEP
eukprot:4142092-Pyramimonas_sp.AAC.1